MKAKIFSILAIAVSIMAACNEENMTTGILSLECVNEIKPSDNESITLQITPQEVPLQSGTFKLAIKNNSSKTIEYGTNFILAYWNKNEWQQVKLNFVFTDILLIQDPHTTKEVNENLMPELHNFKAGRYRYIKEIVITRGGGRYYLFTEFIMK
jgi:hypothetical protein